MTPLQDSAMSTYERNANRLTVFLLMCMVGLAIFGTMQLSGPIPIHFNAAGQANRWGSPSTLLVLALVGVIAVGLLWVIRNTPPELMHFPGPRSLDNVVRQRLNFDHLLATLRVIVAALFFVMIGQILWVGMYHKKSIFLWPSFLFIILIFSCILVGLVRAYRLSSDH
ncbi:DUF1648 domain-containing protein [Spirosoma sp. SC4-14]|uniref:DUF1648 domain-containing protein n=1 Tax=Spirosoma sp. SC4-14 TaxID=3128900 RepID=UPI0030CD62B4